MFTIICPNKKCPPILSRLNAKQSYPFLPMALYSNWTYQKSTGTVPKTKVLSRETSPRTTCIRKLTHVLAATVGLLTFLASYCASTCKQRYNGSCHSSFDYLYPKSESKEKSCANICFTLDSPTLYFAFVLSRLGYVICPLV